jgi:uncharacterized protein YbjT (DUF2867 family)
MTSPLLITGASGTIGTALVAELQRRGVDFATMSSKPGATVAGRPAVFGDFADPASLKAAFAGVHTLFLLFPFTPGSVELARNAVEAAKAAGVKHLVRSSGAGAEAGSPVAIADLQGRIDQLVAQSGIAFTLLRPAGFMQNWVTYSAAAIKAGRFAAANGDGAFSTVDVRDIAEVAAIVLGDPATHAGKTYTLTGGEALTTARQLALIGQAVGHPVTYDAITPEQAEATLRGWGLPDAQIALYSSLAYVYREGWAAGISPDVQAITGHAPRRFADFAKEHAAAWK